MHAVIAMASMQLKKHVYVQKPLTHDIYEARMLTQAAERYKVVNADGQPGRLGRRRPPAGRLVSRRMNRRCDGSILLYEQARMAAGIQWSDKKAPVPTELDWNLWLGTAPYKDYVDNLVPFNWRGWWDYGTGALGDMGCHIVAPAFQVLGLGYPTEAECSVGGVYVGEFKRGYSPTAVPPHRISP